MRINLVPIIVGIGCTMMLSGCGNSSEDTGNGATIAIANTCRTYAELSTNDVIVRVNGAELTKGEVERQIAFRLEMARLRPMNFSENTANREARMRAEMLRTCDRQFIMQELMKGYAASNGITVTSKDRKAMREKLSRMYARGANYAKLVARLSPEQKSLLGDNADREIWTQKGREKLLTDLMKPVGIDEVAKRREYFTKYNEHAKAALDKAWLDATNVWKKATGGYPFEKLVEMYGDGKVEHVLSEGEWGDLRASDYKDDPGLYHALTQTPEGCIPPPFEGDNGLLVVKMLQVTPADPSNGKSEPLYRLSRIHFELPEIWEVETDDEIRKDLEKIHQREALSKGMADLVNASKIEYPCGTNLFAKTSAKTRKLPPEVLRRLPQGMKLPQ